LVPRSSLTSMRPLTTNHLVRDQARAHLLVDVGEDRAFDGVR